MDFTLSEEQQLLKNSVERFIADDYEFTRRMRLQETPRGWSAEHWALYAEQGWLAVPFSEDEGGLGCGPAEIMVLMEAFGRGLVLEPYLSTVILGGGFLRHGGSAAQKETLIPAIVEGRTFLAFAHSEPGMRHNPAGVALHARHHDGHYVLDGKKIAVIDAADADHVIVSARTLNSPGDHGGVTLFLVPRETPGLSLLPYRTVDGRPAADLTFDSVTVAAEAVIGKVDLGLPLIETVLNEANVALVAEAVGCMEALLAATLEYVKTRKQFGRAIGGFQVIQHRMADMYMQVEQARSLMLRAVLTRETADWPRDVAAAKALAAELGIAVGHAAIQLHGGIGMTHELNISHYHKRLLAIATLFGDAAYHRARFRALAAA